MRRLRRTASHVVAPAAAAAQAEAAAEATAGPNVAELVAECKRKQAAAAAAEDYDTAAQMKRQADLLSPRSTPLEPPTAAAPVEDQASFFRTHGYMLWPNAMDAGELAQVQAAWARHEAPVRAEWEAAKLLGEGVSGGLNFERGTWHARKYFDLPRFAELEDCFLRVLELPVVIALMKEVIGGAVLLRSIQARTLPPDGEGGYTQWHRDTDANWDHPVLSQHIKVFVYFSDVSENGGCTAIVPGSHKVRADPSTALGGLRFNTNDNHRFTDVNQHVMPNHLKFAVRAGSVVAFDTRCWHTAMGNTSATDRRNVIITYTPFLHRPNGAVLSNAIELEKAGKLDTPLRRQLFGLMDGDHVHDYHLRHPMPDVR